MKIAVLSDIHANFVALRAVYEHIDAWKPDHVVVAGDIVNRGPRPLECLEFVINMVEKCGWRLIRGNHEDYVISWSAPDTPYKGAAAEVHQASYWTYQKLNFDVSALVSMPFQQSIWGPDGREFRFVHASMLGNRDGIYPETSDSALIRKIGLSVTPYPIAGICVGHTHRPLIRHLDHVLVVNAGSAGLPFDGNNRPSYAQITLQENHWRATIVRVDYNLIKAAEDFRLTGYIDDAGPLAELVLVELLEARSQLYQWAVKYQHRAMIGDLTMHESVRQFLAETGDLKDSEVP